MKDLVAIAAVLLLLGITATKHPHRGPCPLHGHGRGTARVFSANLRDNVWNCFQCGRHGNALDLWCAATGKLPYDAAVELCERLGLTLPLLKKPDTEKRNE